jgi:hypothetical protein
MVTRQQKAPRHTHAGHPRLSPQCAVTFRIVGGWVVDYQIFMDVNPVFA